MKKRIFSLLLCLCMVLTLVPMSAVFAEEAAKLYVNNASTSEATPDGTQAAPYLTVQEAITAANAGDTIYIVATATAYDAFYIPKEKTGITIEGILNEGAKPVIKTCYEDSPTWIGYNTSGNPTSGETGNGGISLYAANVTLKNLCIKHLRYTKGWHTASVGYYYENTSPKDNLTIDSCDFIGTGTGTAIMYNESNFTLKNSTFTGFATGYLSAADNTVLEEVSITGNSYTDVDTVVNAYWGGNPESSPESSIASNTITITGNTITNTDGEESVIVITDQGQEVAAKGYAAINVTITDNTGDTDISLICVNMVAENTIVLDQAAADDTTVYHRVTVDPGEHDSVTITTGDGESTTITEAKSVPLPVTSDMTFENNFTVTGSAPVTLTYTTGTETTTETVVVVPGAGGSTTNKVYQITFNAGGGNASSTMLYTDTVGLLSGLPTAYRGGYNFDGWYTEAVGGTEITAATVFEADTVVYAHWTQQIIPQMRMDNFATTTGEFKDVEYFGTAVKPGDMVTLKVSTSDLGDQYGLDYHKITVVYETEGAVIVNNNYDYSGDPIYKDGIATDFVLNEGLNKIVAKIYYNGVYCGEFAPFYTLI